MARAGSVLMVAGVALGPRRRHALLPSRMAAMLPVLLFSLALSFLPVRSQQTCRGSFQVLLDTGISSITVGQSIDGFMYLLDRNDFQNSRINTTSGEFAHAVEYDIANNKVRAIETVTNTWCSAGAYLPDGTIINTAGSYYRGLQAVRTLRPCSLRTPVPPVRLTGGDVKPCREWYENWDITRLNATRWYPTAQQLPDNRIFVCGGSDGRTSASGIIPSYEFVDPWKKVVGPTFDFPFLRKCVPNYLYPVIHLLPSNTLFIFANMYGIIFNYIKNVVVMDVPTIPGGISRSYPSTGASALLPLVPRGRYRGAEVLICGGGKEYAQLTDTADNTCYRIDVSSWSLKTRTLTWRGPEYLARPRIMPELVFLLDGSLALINGAQTGFAGYNSARNPNYWPEIYYPFNSPGQRIKSDLCRSPIARGYHATASLIPDGRLFIAGSNGYWKYNNNPADPLRTEWRAEAWSPPYLQSTMPRPIIHRVPRSAGHAKVFKVTFTLTKPPLRPVMGRNTAVGLISNSFTTHSMSMNQRYLYLRVVAVRRAYPLFTLVVVSPPNKYVAPDGYYMLTVVHRGIPSVAKWVQIIN